jgi:hypothetical protein
MGAIIAATEAATAVAAVAGEDAAGVVAAALEIPFSMHNLYNGPEREKLSHIREDLRLSLHVSNHPDFDVLF